MTSKELPSLSGGPFTASAGNTPPPRPPAPPDVAPSVTVTPPSGQAVAGIAATFTVNANTGTHYVWDGEGWDAQDAVTYTELRVSVDGAEVVRDHRGTGASETLTFSRPGVHSVTASALTTTGALVTSPAISVRVAAAAPPAFTVSAPANGLVVDLNDGGGQVDVKLTVTADQYFPLSVTITRDGQTTAPETIADATTLYQKTVSLAPLPLGARSVSVTLTDPDARATTQSRSVTGRDVAPPHLQVDFPQPSANVMGDGSGAATVMMHGTAPDGQSRMTGGSASVAWALSPSGTRTSARPVNATDFSSWTASVPLSGFGAHTIYVWATDHAGNTTSAPVAVPVVVISSYVPATLDQRLDEREYLAALLSFAQEQVTVPGAPAVPLDTQTLVAALGQPVDRLSQPLSAAFDSGSREVNQLRVPVELLRARIAATGASTAAGAAGEAAYRGIAYTALLSAAGTSYAELRLARGAEPAVRQALAARLGIRLSATAPDELDQLLLDSAQPAEAAMETVFGLPATSAADPLRIPATPLLLAWQMAGLAVTWSEQDQHPTVTPAYGALADPDVISAADVVAGPDGDRIRTLLSARHTQLTTYAASLADARTKAPDAPAGLAAMQTLALPGVDLTGLQAADAQGTDIGPDLAAAGLTRGGFLFLMKLSRLAAAGNVTGAEWDDAVAVLTGAHKASLYPIWRAQESVVVLSPDFFVLTDDGRPQVSPFRVDPRARADWQTALRTRTSQRADLVDASARAVASAEQIALPVLRDALLADLAPTGTGDIGEEMSARFLVDMLAAGVLRTTRISQAVESVQSLLAAKRSGELPTGHPAAGWTLNDFDGFTAAWAWMGEQGSWQAATLAFLFPERHLDPALLVPAAGPLRTLFDNVSGGAGLSAADAAAEAAAYLVALKLGFGYLDPQRTAAHQAALRDLSKAQPEPAAREIFWAVPLLLAQRLQAAGDYQAALDWYWILYPYDVASPVSVYNRINTETLVRPDLTFPPRWTTALDPFTLVTGRPAPYTRYTLLSLVRCHLDYADAEFTRETDESVAHARTLYVTARRLLGTAALQPQQPTNSGEPTLAIPDLDVLRGKAEAQLAKIRQGRNIAGMPRTQGLATTATVSRPTPYRFKVLLERARQLASQAAQMEAGFLSALEKYDDRNLRLYDATKGIDLAAAQVDLAASRVREAGDAVGAALSQQTKADTMATTYADAIDAPASKYENDLLSDYDRLQQIRDGIAAADTVIGALQAASHATNLWDAVTSFGTNVAYSGEIIAATVAKGVGETLQNYVDAQVQANQLKAGIVQRQDDWRRQEVAARQDSLIAASQVTTARDQVTIALQEQDAATLQHDQAVATLKFLKEQFTNADLYLWLSNTIGGVYRYFLQQATATARLAQAQLGFERAEPAQALIRNDYWQSPGEMTANSTQTGHRGLTGAEQLTADLARLDDYSFSSARRRLNLSQTFSLARLMPADFIDFRRTGKLAFATPTALFDADFPGHYLRLIRQVRTSLVALVPPDRGIRATLSSNGISRVTTGADGVFQDVTLRSDPGIVALTSPISASGVFELDVQSDLLLPFESSGVDTTWEFQLPPPANPFDFSAIADVLLTIDYTAAYDETYREQQITRLNADRSRGADCVFSLARDFPDQWYDLNNPAGPDHRSVTLTLRDVDFPLGFEEMSAAAVTVRLSAAGEVPDTVVTLTRGTVGGAATATGGLAGTRRGNAPAWIPLCAGSPAGDWQLGFGTDADTLFGAGGLDDIMIVVGWTGLTPVWTP